MKTESENERKTRRGYKSTGGMIPRLNRGEGVGELELEQN